MFDKEGFGAFRREEVTKVEPIMDGEVENLTLANGVLTRGVIGNACGLLVTEGCSSFVNYSWFCYKMD